MSDIKVKANELEDFADQIGKAERECNDALDAINWHFTSLLANFPGVVPGSIHNLEADLKYSIKKYKSKLDDAQQLIKLTAASMKNDEQKMSGKVGEFLLELVGWYDIQRVFSEYDPVTGEKLSAGDRVVAVGFLALSFIPPAKAVGVGGKAAVKGVKAGLPTLAKSPEAFMKIRNVLDPKKVQQAFRSVYNEVVKGPIAATKVWFDKVKKGIGDIPIPQIRQEAFAGVGVVNKTVKDAFGEAKDFVQRIKSSRLDGLDVKKVEGGTEAAEEVVTKGARYGERKISDDTYAKLRRASPSSKIQREVNKNIDDIIGTEDFALPGKIIDKKLHADHIVSLEKIARMESFEALTYKQQKEIANFIENFIGLSEAANTSKGSKSFADWYIYKKENITVNPEFRERMILKEKELEIKIQQMIDEFNRVNKKE